MTMKPNGPVHRIRRQALALWKRLLSYRKHTWEFEDYPIIFQGQDPEPASSTARGQVHPHVARIVNWWLSGTGETRADALADLRSTFQNVCAARSRDGKPLPRPGVEVPLEFACRDRIEAVHELADDFIHRVLGFEWAFISDESSLWDFHTETTNEAFVTKIREVYCVDVTDLESAHLCEILERIEHCQAQH